MPILPNFLRRSQPRRRRMLLSVAIVVVSILIAAWPVWSVTAQDLAQGEQCSVAGDAVVNGNLYALCQNLVIDGQVHGDVVALAGSVILNGSGSVTRDVVAVAGQVIVRGTVGGQIRAVGGSVQIAPDAHLTAEHADVAALSLDTQILAPLSGDVLAAGYQARIENVVGGTARFTGAALTLAGAGQIGGSADLQVLVNLPRPPDLFGLSFGSPGLNVADAVNANTPRVKGSLRYEAPAQINLPPGMVGGEVRFVQGPTNGLIGGAPFAEVMANYIGRVLHDLLALMAIGLVALLVTQRTLQDISRQLRSRPRQSVGIGAAAVLISFPALGLLILLSAVIVALLHLLTLGELTPAASIALLTINLLVAGTFWLAAIYVGRLAVCYVIGQWIGRRILLVTDRATTQVISLLLGTVVFSLLANIPVDGYSLVVNTVAVCFGLGAILLALRNVVLRPTLRTPLPESDIPPIAVLLPGFSEGFPPIPEDIESLPGMDNLPEGFTWFEE